MRVKHIFQGIANKMLIDFDEIQEQIVHSGIRGGQREQTLRDFLAKYLPKRYSVGTGHVMDREGKMSSQCDIVVYDSFNCPLILVEEGYQIFPAEAVLAVIEVKSILDAGSMKEAVQNIQGVKSLHKDEPIAGCLFAYRTNYVSQLTIETVAESYLKKGKDVLPSERIDLVCVLAEGLLRHYKGAPTWGKDITSNVVYVILEASPSTLLLFLSLLMGLLGERNTTVPSLVHYATDGELGIVRTLGLCECGSSLKEIIIKKKKFNSIAYSCEVCGKIYDDISDD